MGHLILSWGGQEWEAPEEEEDRCWVGEDFTEEVTFVESLEVRLSCYVVIELCPLLCNPMDYSPPGSSVHGIS